MSAQAAKALAKVHESAPHTGRRTLAGIARVFDYARVKGLIDARRPNPATFRGGFEHLWGPPEPTRHLRAVGYADVPDLYSQLSDLEDMSAAWCLRLLILTWVRTSNALYARFDQIDLRAGTWTIQPEDMKKNEKMKDRPAFVVPLVPEAVAIVTAMRERWPEGELMTSLRPTLRQTAPSIPSLRAAICAGRRGERSRLPLIDARLPWRPHQRRTGDRRDVSGALRQGRRGRLPQINGAGEKKDRVDPMGATCRWQGRGRTPWCRSNRRVGVTDDHAPKTGRRQPPAGVHWPTHRRGRRRRPPPKARQRDPFFRHLTGGTTSCRMPRAASRMTIARAWSKRGAQANDPASRGVRTKGS